MPSPNHPLVRRRRILAEAFKQVHETMELMALAGYDTTGIERDRDRIHLRLIKTQQMCEKFDVD